MHRHHHDEDDGKDQQSPPELQILQLQKFPMRKMKRDSIVGLLGRRGSGKTFVLWDIMQKLRDIPEGIVFSGTEDSNDFWKRCIPDSYIFTKYNEEKVQALIDRQKSRPKTAFNDDGAPCPPPVFLVLDDMIHEKHLLAKSPALNYIFLNGRQSKIFCIIAMQESTAFPPSLRLQFDYMFLCYTDSYQEKEKIYERFFGLIRDRMMFYDVVSQTTENYRCLVLDNKPLTCDLQRRLFWYKVADIKRRSHRVGSIAYWAAHERYSRQAAHNRRMIRARARKLIAEERARSGRIIGGRRNNNSSNKENYNEADYENVKPRKMYRDQPREMSTVQVELI